MPEWTTLFEGNDDIIALLNKAATANRKHLMGNLCSGWGCQTRHCECSLCALIGTLLESTQRAVPYGANWSNSFYCNKHLALAVEGLINAAYSRQAQMVLRKLHVAMDTAQLRRNVLAYVPLGEDDVTDEVCRGFVVKYLCERVMLVRDGDLAIKRWTLPPRAPAPQPRPVRDRYLWTNPLWFGKGLRCRGPHVDESPPEESNRYCCCTLIEISVRDGRSAPSKTVVAHRFAADTQRLGAAMQQIFESDIWQQFRHLQVYFYGCSTEVMRLPGTCEAEDVIFSDVKLKMLAAAPGDSIVGTWPAFRSEVSRVGDDGKLFSISNPVGDKKHSVTKSEYFAAAEKLHSTTAGGEQVFALTEHITIYVAGSIITRSSPWSPEVNEGVALTNTMTWKMRIRHLHRFKRLQTFTSHLEVEFSDAFRGSIICDDCSDEHAGLVEFNDPERAGTHIMCMHGEDDAALQHSLQLARVDVENYRLEQELGDDFDSLMAFRELTQALTWHYTRVFKTLYGKDVIGGDFSKVWPILRGEHVADNKKEVCSILRAWFALRPGLCNLPWVLNRRSAETFKNAAAWERKRQLSVGERMQKLQGEKLPHLKVPGLLSQLDTVHRFLPCVKTTLAGSRVWNKECK
ncbi:hypothetical protein JKP88DRAFT_248298 [Tribonema minus]|uniref:Uncharacterized protein n=1 Tax=Tribonema minus TaxID=303371 RepID=A0A835YMY7_9STRA|nr:hypothetical protein JKP88DRAFT_248298 [Tribonema minus]